MTILDSPGAVARPSRQEDFIRRYWVDEVGVPKHERLKRAFTESISDGFWAAGARLPTESELVKATACSLGTIQRALRELAADGLVRRKRGSGSVVADLHVPIEAPWHIRYLDAKRGTGGLLPVFTTVVRRQVSSRKGPWSPILEQLDEPVVEIDRVFSVNDEVRIYSRFWAIASRFPDLVQLPPDALSGQNLKIVIARKYRLPVSKVRQRLRWEVPPATVVRHSDCVAGVPATVLNVVAIALNGHTIYYQDFYIPPSRYELDLGTATN